MPCADYWDIDEILAEEQDVVIKTFHDVAGGGFLYPCTGAAKPRDLKEGAKVVVPYWLAQKLVRRNAVELDLPVIFDEATQETLQTDPAVCRLGEKSRYYFEVGLKLAYLTKNFKLQEILVNAYMPTGPRFAKQCPALRTQKVKSLESRSDKQKGLHRFSCVV
ncbi:unnamed protein product [Durusdinium trenchii]|uniref:DNA replication complex GINS protein PSF3 N-terminal domain-containing protein n=1 Tax=Durusdinium trenchii TaxID=1381693 RepID=A0ABP0I0K6_9DINO